MRTNLITNFHCSKCGHSLCVEYEKETTPKLIEKSERGDPSGGFCVHIKVIVEPCQKCIDLVTNPAKKMIEAINELNHL